MIQAQVDRVRMHLRVEAQPMLILFLMMMMMIISTKSANALTANALVARMKQTLIYEWEVLCIN